MFSTPIQSQNIGTYRSVGLPCAAGQAEAKAKRLADLGLRAYRVAMRDEVSDPLSSPEPSRPVVESIPPDEPKTPAWLTWVGFALFLLVLGWFAARCASEDAQASSDPGADSAKTP